MGRILRLIQYYLLGLAGIVLVSALPVFFTNNGLLSLISYGREVVTLIGSLLSPEKWVYVENTREVPILPYLWDPYVYSMQVVLAALVLGFLLAILLGAGTIFLPSYIRSVVKRLLNLLETIPDLLIAFIIQLAIVAIYKKTGVLVAQFATMGGDQIYLAPIVTLAVLPLISFYKVMVLFLEEEMTKHYVQFAQSKGVKHRSIVLVHVFRNTVRSLFYHSKIIVWSTLSSLLVVEYVFNMHGITTMIMEDFRPLVTAVILWMVFTPFFLIYQGIDLLITRNESKTVTVRFKSARFWSRWRQWPIWDLLWRGFKETITHFKNVKFTIGFLVIFGMLAFSVYHSLTADVLVKKYEYIYGDNHRLISAPPHSPKYVFMGTDPLGFSIWDQLVAGAKYTILFAVLIAFLRVAGGLALSIPYAFLLKDKWQERVSKVVDSLHYLPLSVMALVILYPILVKSPDGFQYELGDRIILEVLVLTILALPLLTTLIGNEIRLLMQQEFILGARVLGGNNRHMLWRHLLPHLGSRLGIVFGQQFIQTLLVFIHLGVFGLFFGGTIKTFDPFFSDPVRSYSYEWSGLISSARTSLMTGQLWMIIPVLLGFVILIISMQLIVEGIKDVQQKRVGVRVVDRRSWLNRLRARRKQHANKTKQPVKQSGFTFVNKEKSNLRIKRGGEN